MGVFFFIYIIFFSFSVSAWLRLVNIAGGAGEEAPITERQFPTLVSVAPATNCARFALRGCFCGGGTYEARLSRVEML